MIVWCNRDDCKYWDEGMCKGEVISIDEGGECMDFDTYLEEKEWQTPYWKRMLDKPNNRICRVQYYGKEFEIKGRKFFVDHKGDYANVTDYLTGLSCGARFYLNDERVDKVIERAPQIEPRLEDLPIATYDEKTRKFTYESEVEAE